MCQPLVIGIVPPKSPIFTHLPLALRVDVKEVDIFLSMSLPGVSQMGRISSCRCFSKTERDICHVIYDTANVSPKRSSAASYLHVGAQECAHSSTMVKRSQLALRTYVGKRLNCISSSSSPSVSLKRPVQFPRV